MRSNRLIMAAIVIVILILPGLAGCSSLAENEAAKVNGRPITRSQLAEYAGELARKEKQVDLPQERLLALEMQALDELIIEELILQQAEERGLTVDDGEVESRLAQIKAEAFDNDDKKLDQALQNQGITLEEAKNRLGKSILAAKLHDQVVEAAADVSDQEIEEYFHDNQEMFSQPERRHLRHLLAASESDARSAKARLEAGTDPALVTAETSLDVNTKGKGGDLGWMAQGVAAPAFDKVAFSLASGVWSEPVQTPSGWNIIRVEEIKPGGIPGLEEVKEAVRESLVTQLVDEAWTSWLDEIRREADIEYMSDYKALEGKSRDGSGSLPAGHP